MENLPAIIEEKTIPLTFTIENYMRDHYFLGKTILPAVELMQLMSRSAQSHLPGLDPGRLREVDFLRFISFDSEVKSIELFNKLEVSESGWVTSRIMTRQSGKSGITRTREHVTARFPNDDLDTIHDPSEYTAGFEGVSLEVDPESIYRDLVPFGPSYRNIESPLLVWERGTLCRVRGGTGDASSGPLGSPFPLDAAFHAASVWCQRYRGFVGFPVGITHRRVLKQTEAGKSYFSRTMAKEQGREFLTVDIWIYDDRDELYEIIKGVRFRDVSAGKIAPPLWIRDE